MPPNPVQSQEKIASKRPYPSAPQVPEIAEPQADSPVAGQLIKKKAPALTAENVLQLQRTLGNQAVVQLQARNKDSAPANSQPVIQRAPAPAQMPRHDKVWKALTTEQQDMLHRLVYGQNLNEIAVQLKKDNEWAEANHKAIYAACQEAWGTDAGGPIDDAWLKKQFASYPPLKSMESIEFRAMQPGGAASQTKTQDVTAESADGKKFTWDPFDYTLVVERPDGTGVQLTYVFPKGEQTGKLTKVVELSKRRVLALKEMSKFQGTYQETEEAHKSRVLAKTGTLCNAWPVKVGTVVDKAEEEEKVVSEKKDEEAQKDPDKASEANKKVVLNEAQNASSAKGLNEGQTLNDRSTLKDKNSALNNLNPEGAARKYGAWRTWADTPAGPKPGDMYSFWEAKLKTPGADPNVEANVERLQLNKHIGTFKSRRPNPDGKSETWTVVDGGQGGRQEVRERNRTFHVATQIFTTGAADGGQSADPRWISGWLDLDAYYTNPETAATKADHEKWKKDTTTTWKRESDQKLITQTGGKTAKQTGVEVPAEQWPKELNRNEVQR